jgi:hypothetical protein
VSFLGLQVGATLALASAARHASEDLDSLATAAAAECWDAISQCVQGRGRVGTNILLFLSDGRPPPREHAASGARRRLIAARHCAV